MHKTDCVQETIGARLAEIRRGKDASQSEFAHHIGLTRAQLSNVEMGRSSLRYGPAARALDADDSSYDTRPFLHPLNPLWLAGLVDWPMQLDWPFLLPPLASIGLSSSTKFSQFVLDHQGLLKSLTSRDISGARLPDRWLRPYFMHWCRLQTRYEQSFDGCLKVQELFADSAKSLAKASPNARGLLKVFGKTSPMAAAYIEFLKEKHPSQTLLTQDSENRNKSSMQMRELLERVRALTSAGGMKAKLASDLDVPLPRVSEWLSGKYQPNGETTLRLLQWVQEQERSE